MNPDTEFIPHNGPGASDGTVEAGPGCYERTIIKNVWAKIIERFWKFVEDLSPESRYILTYFCWRDSGPLDRQGNRKFPSAYGGEAGFASDSTNINYIPN
jgi:hypothetical protein